MNLQIETSLPVLVAALALNGVLFFQIGKSDTHGVARECLRDVLDIPREEAARDAYWDKCGWVLGPVIDAADRIPERQQTPRFGRGV